MEQLLTREFTMNLNFEKRNIKLIFDEPTIFNLLKFAKLISDERYIEAIKIIIPNIKESDFLSNPVGIVNGIKTLIYGEQKKETGTDFENDEEGFFPSCLDIIGNRYGILPTELIKQLTFSQMIIVLKGYEWNLNIQIGKEEKNAFILHEFSEDSAEDKKQIEKLLNRKRKV